MPKNRIYDREDIQNEETITPQELQETMYPGFAIRCTKCNGERVVFDNTLGWSEGSGAWGSIDLICLDCENLIEICES